MMKWSWWRARLGETAAAVVIAFVVIQLSHEVADRQKALMPPSAWFVVNEIYVPDHVAGENPDIIYDREIRENFDAFWIAEIQRKTRKRSSRTTRSRCSGSRTPPAISRRAATGSRPTR